MKPSDEFKNEKPKPYWLELGNTGSRLLIDPECPPTPGDISAAFELAQAVNRTGDDDLAAACQAAGIKPELYRHERHERES